MENYYTEPIQRFYDTALSINESYYNFENIENASRKDLNEFIRSVTEEGSNIGQGLLQPNEQNNRKRLFLLDDNETEVQTIFNFNVLVYVGDIYQKKVLPPGLSSENLSPSYPIINEYEINYEYYINALINIFLSLTTILVEDETEGEADLLSYMATIEIDNYDIIDADTTLAEVDDRIADNAAGKSSKTDKNSPNTPSTSTFIGYRKIDPDEDENNKEGFVGMGNKVSKTDENSVIITQKQRPEYSKDYERLYQPLPNGIYGDITKTKTIKQTISIDSRHRDNYYTTLSTNYTFNISERQNNVIQMSIIAMEMPMTFYSISNNLGNSTMLIISDSDTKITNYDNVRNGIDAEYQETPIASLDYIGNDGENILGFTPVRRAWRVRLMDGNYDTRSWMTTKILTEKSMNDAIMVAAPGATDENGRFYRFASTNMGDYLNNKYVSSDNNDIRFKINNITGKSVFASKLANDETINKNRVSGLRFNVDNDGNLDTETSIYTRLGWALGFRAAEYVMGGITPVTIYTPISAVSEGIGFINSIRYGYLSIEEYKNDSHPPLIVAFNDNILDKKIMTRISLAPIKLGHDLTSRETGYITHRRTPRNYYNAVNIDKLTIKLFDEYGRIIDLNNMDWSLTMEFTKLY
tara:strand:+ start:2425 stop:4341 length:1917 start_codon:yes stop_codon:yes gene_type:complete